MSQIQTIQRKDLNLDKYTQALQQSMNYRIYAEFWYLDVLTDGNWECWVYGDYEVIMPVAFQKKFGIKFILQPTYCQQLGVFYKEEISKELFQQFEKKLHKKFVRSYCFNEENTETFHPKGQLKSNYVLDLNRPYETIKKQFSKSTKWNLKQFEKSELQIHTTDQISSILSLKKSIANFKVPDIYQTLLKEINQNSTLNHLIVSNHLDQIIAYGSFILTQNRIIYLDAGANEEGKKSQIPTGILCEMIQKFSTRNISLDFEGSSIPHIEFFFKGFKGDKKTYCCYRNIRR